MVKTFDYETIRQRITAYSLSFRKSMYPRRQDHEKFLHPGRFKTKSGRFLFPIEHDRR